MDFFPPSHLGEWRHPQSRLLRFGSFESIRFDSGELFHVTRCAEQPALTIGPFLTSDEIRASSFSLVELCWIHVIWSLSVVVKYSQRSVQTGVNGIHARAQYLLFRDAASPTHEHKTDVHRKISWRRFLPQLHQQDCFILHTRLPQKIS